MPSKPSRLWDEVVGQRAASKEEERQVQRRADLVAHWAEAPWNWISGVDTSITDKDFPKGRPIIWTSDERNEELPVRQFPVEKEYLHRLVNDVHSHKDVLIDKARQMLVTITLCLYIDWHCAFRENRLWLVSKIKEEAASKIINDKIRAPFRRLPEWVQAIRPIKAKPMNKILYTESASTVMAVAENAAVGDLRGNTASGLFCDEAAFQNEFKNMLVASQPMASKFVGCSTPQVGTPGGRAYKFFLDEGREQ